MKEYLNTNFSDIVYGENGFLVELRCNNTFQVQLFGKIKAYLLENQPAWKAAGAIPIPDAVAIFNLIDQLAGGNRVKTHIVSHKILLSLTLRRFL